MGKFAAEVFGVIHLVVAATGMIAAPATETLAAPAQLAPAASQA